MIPARRTYALLIGITAIALSLTAFTPPSALGSARWLTLGIDGIIVALMLMDWLKVRSHAVVITRELAPKLSIGRDNPVTLTIKTDNHPSTLQIRDRTPSSIPATPPQFDLTLPPYHTETLTYTVHPTQRGEYDWKAIDVRQRGAWGLAWHQWSIPLPQTTAVYPDLIGLRSLSIKLTLQSSGNIRRARRLGTGTEFAELRDYSTGDDPRFIDWNATARRGRPLIRVLEPEQEQTLIILLDRGRLMTAQVNGLARFDWGLNATLALALAGLNRGDRVGVGVFDRTLHTWVPPERGQTHLSTLIERLTPIQPVLLEPDYVNAVSQTTKQQTRRALVVIITDIVDKTASSELLTALGQLAPRYLPFCVTLRDPQVDAQAHTPTTEVESAYKRAVALDLLAQRQLAFALLHQKSVLVLDAPAHLVSDQLVDRYLQLKARSQL
ncbi:MAG: DUF58 domain-containing protein [Synechococcales cyanobacterium T60_A2020_003]|nr:DUF58 domain-containing protein [Synechococcales cyanobacterium T60_A2020_003]